MFLMTAATSLRSAGQVAKGLMSPKTTSEVQAKAIELNGLILDAQSDLLAALAAQASLVEEVRELKEQIARTRGWETHTQRHQLAIPCARCVLYALKKAMSDGQPPNYLCTNCYEGSKRTSPQGFLDTSTRAFFKCPVCRLALHTPDIGTIGPKYDEEIGQP
jgi:hypothetical protein